MENTQNPVHMRQSNSTTPQVWKDKGRKQRKNNRSNAPDEKFDNAHFVAQESKEIRNSVPSHMKWQAIWVIKTGETLTAKRHTRVIINQNMEDDDVTSVNHVTIIEETKEESSIENDAEDALPTLKKVCKLQWRLILVAPKILNQFV